MRRFAAIAMIAFATAGCIGSSSAGSSHGHSSSSTTRRMPKADVTITYSNCPPGGKCPSDMATLRLTCSPAGGDYDNPAAACRALADIVTKRLHQHPAVMCSCLLIKRAPRAVGYYDGRRRTIRLDACSLCGIQGIGADLAVLLPGLQG
jgi:hypothetical protein